MSRSLPRIRTDLEFLPSPLEDQPGLLIRDAYNYSEVTLILPPLLARCLGCFDGRQTELDLRELLVRITGTLEVGEVIQHLMGTLSDAGFLEDDTYRRMREKRHREFAEAPVREAGHGGSSYPEDPEELRSSLEGCIRASSSRPSGENLIGITAPHVSLEGGGEVYGAAYGALTASTAGRTFVVLGSSHYGEPGRFGLTRKPFRTPLGTAPVDAALVDALARDGGAAVEMEDYCHAVEHSVEFQVLFLQHLFGPEVRILPVLCGSYGRSLVEGGAPEDDAHVRRFLEALRAMAAREENRLFWVLGVDMAHMGRRYGDALEAVADQGPMLEVADRDRRRIERVLEGDSRGFWELVRHDGDDLKWCGASPIYTFLQAVPGARGEMLRYRQWNIDENSVVSFAAIAFHLVRD